MPATQPSSSEARPGRAASFRGAARRPTVSDVARAANVSRATVSYVLTGKPNHRITPATAARVREAAAALGYQPSVAARALKLGRSDTVLALMPNWPVGHTQAKVFELLAADLEDAGLTFMICPATGSRPGWAPDTWRGVTPVAIITFAPMDPTEAAKITDEGVIIEEWFGPSSPSTAHEGRPFSSIGRLQVEHLVAAGHTRLGYAYPADRRVRAFAEARLRGVREACEQHELSAPAIVDVALTEGSAREAVGRWRSVGVTAVCAYNDDVALAVMAAVHDLGLRVPDDLGVIGVENTPAGALYRPALTTVAIDNAPRAQFVVASLLAKLHGTAPPEHATNPDHVVVVREST